MKSGRNISDIAKEIQTTREQRDDLIFPGRVLQLGESGENLIPSIGHGSITPFHMTDVAHGCLSRRLDIPKSYYDRMRKDAPALLSENVNRWLDSPDRHLVRSLKSPNGSAPTCRAILSERYKIIDNDIVMENLFPILQEQRGMEVVSTEITPTKFYLKAQFPEMEREIKLNDPVRAGIVISNSEVGHGSTSVSLLIYRLRCLNGMVLADEHFKSKRSHLGGVLQNSDDFRIVASAETERLADETFLSGLKDIVKMAADPDVFANVCDQLIEATTESIRGNVEEAVLRVTKKLSLTETEGASVLENLVRDGDYSKWGMANAVTRTAEDVASYDRASELEKLGGAVINFRSSEWSALAA